MKKVFKLKSGNNPIFKHVGSSPIKATPDPAGQNYPSRKDENKLKRDLKQSQTLDKLKENLLKSDAERKKNRNKPLTDWMIEDLLEQGVKVKNMPSTQGELYDYYERQQRSGSIQNPGKYTKTLPNIPDHERSLQIPKFFGKTKPEEGYGRFYYGYKPE